MANTEPPAWPHAHPPINPMQLFTAWFREAHELEVPGPRAMVLATVSVYGLPTQRVVILREHDADALVFTSSATSRKGVDLARHPQAAAHFHWPGVNRQISFSGEVQQLSSPASDALFSSRPDRAKAVAMCSEQSAPLVSAQGLRAAVDGLANGASPLQRPASQVGYRLLPRSVEFWSGRDDELHDRLRFERGNGGWDWTALQP